MSESTINEAQFELPWQRTVLSFLEDLHAGVRIAYRNSYYYLEGPKKTDWPYWINKIDTLIRSIPDSAGLRGKYATSALAVLLYRALLVEWLYSAMRAQLGYFDTMLEVNVYDSRPFQAAFLTFEYAVDPSDKNPVPFYLGSRVDKDLWPLYERLLDFFQRWGNLRKFHRSNAVLGSLDPGFNPSPQLFWDEGLPSLAEEIALVRERVITDVRQELMRMANKPLVPVY